MEKFPSSNVYIVKVIDSVYFSFLENRDGTRIKFFGTGEVISVGQLNSYIQSAYGKSPEWVRCMQGKNNFYTEPKQYFHSAAAYQTPIQSISIYDEISNLIGSEPTYSDYMDDDDGAYSHKLIKKELKKDTASYNANKKNYPKLPYGSVTEEEICDIMSWYAQQDKKSKAIQQKSSNYSDPSVLDF